jgi:hypothetical protein
MRISKFAIGFYETIISPGLEPPRAKRLGEEPPAPRTKSHGRSLEPWKPHSQMEKSKPI